MKHFFVFAGEASGDLHGSYLVRALKERFPASSFEGVPGPRMRQEDVHALLTMEDFEVMGFTDVIASLPSLIKKFYRVRNAILSNNYDAVILIDYPGFNLRLAKSLRKKGYKGKIIQYICPTVWAHGRSRIQHMASTLDLLLTIYPFEQACFEATALPIAYIGNPLQEYVQHINANHQWRKSVGLESSERFVALFPGSREGEIIRNLPSQLEAADSLKQTHSGLRFAISCAHPKTRALVSTALQATSLDIQKDIVFVPKEYTYDMMGECHTALAKSGTVTLELALRQKPTVVTYRLTALNKFIARYILRVNLPHYCIVNILGKKAVYPEFIDSKLPAHEINKQLHRLHVDGPARAECIAQCQEVAEQLGQKPSSHRAAEAIGRLLQ